VHRLIAFVAVSLIASACVPSPGNTPATTAAPTTTTSSPAPPATTTPQASSCGIGETFSEDGEIFSLESQSGDATRISGLNGVQDQGCDRFIISLATDAGAPATSVGRTRVVFLRDLGVVRVFLPDVTDTNITDGVFELPLIDRAYVVRSADGSLYVDAHLGAAAMARTVVTESPAQIIVELDPGGPALPPVATRSDLVVVLTPREGRASYPLIVTGYSRTFEANVVVRLVKAEVVAEERVTTATDYLSAWGEFTVTLETGPLGKLQLTVGDDSDQDVTINLVLN